MRNRLLCLILALGVLIAMPLSAYSQAMRTFNSPVNPMRKLAAQFTSSSIFYVGNPDPSGAALTRTSSTGKSTGDGTVTVSLATAGYTAPITMTCYLWQNDAVTPANSCWVRLAPVASGGQSNYTQAVDHTYAIFQFAIPPNSFFLVTSSAAVTGNVYTDAYIDPSNPNSATGF